MPSCSSRCRCDVCRSLHGNDLSSIPYGSFKDMTALTHLSVLLTVSVRLSLRVLTTTTTTTVLRPFFRDHPGEPVPAENFWTLWCKERLTEADAATIRLGATPSGLPHLHHPPYFLQAGCPSCRPTNSVCVYLMAQLLVFLFLFSICHK